MTNRYEIDGDLTVRVYMQDLDHEPWITQPDHPEGRPWKDRSEAVAFGEKYAALAAQVYADEQIEKLKAEQESTVND